MDISYDVPWKLVQLQFKDISYDVPWALVQFQVLITAISVNYIYYHLSYNLKGQRQDLILRSFLISHTQNHVYPCLLIYNILSPASLTCVFENRNIISTNVDVNSVHTYYLREISNF